MIFCDDAFGRGRAKAGDLRADSLGTIRNHRFLEILISHSGIGNISIHGFMFRRTGLCDGEVLQLSCLPSECFGTCRLIRGSLIDIGKRIVERSSIMVTTDGVFESVKMVLDTDDVSATAEMIHLLDKSATIEG